MSNIIKVSYRTIYKNQNTIMNMTKYHCLLEEPLKRSSVVKGLNLQEELSDI